VSPVVDPRTDAAGFVAAADDGTACRWSEKTRNKITSGAED
jgi:hypothetical protein